MAKAKKIDNTSNTVTILEIKVVTGTVLPEELNVRSMARKDSDVLEIIKKDSVVKLIKNETIGDFYNVETEAGTIGYVMSQFIEID